jgi:hypothetical protein
MLITQVPIIYNDNLKEIDVNETSVYNIYIELFFYYIKIDFNIV